MAESSSVKDRRSRCLGRSSDKRPSFHNSAWLGMAIRTEQLHKRISQLRNYKRESRILKRLYGESRNVVLKAEISKNDDEY
jgi:hypothetical protein